MKKYLFLLVFILPLVVFAQDKSFVAKGGFGSIMLNDDIYNKVSLMPELKLGKIGIGLNVELLIDKDGNIYDKDWDEWKDYVNKILFLRFAQKGDPFYFKVGSIASYTLGHGLIMKKYSNMLMYPNVKKQALEIGFSLGKFSLDVFNANVIENDILAGRFAFRPFSRFEIGVSGAVDLDQFNGMIDQDKDDYPDIYDDLPQDKDYYDKDQKDQDDIKVAYIAAHGDDSGFTDWFQTYYLNGHKTVDDVRQEGSKRIVEVGVDYNLDIIQGDVFYLQNYGEFAQVLNYGFGLIFPGFFAKFSIFDINLEFRHFRDQFMGPHFDNLYDQNRISWASIEGSDSIIICTKEESLKKIKSSNGWYGEISSDIFGVLLINASYQDMFSAEERIKSVGGLIGLKSGVIPKISVAQIGYTQNNEEQLLKYLKTINTQIDGKVGVAINEVTSINWLYSERYEDLDGSGKIDKSQETISNISFGVEMTF